MNSNATGHADRRIVVFASNLSFPIRRGIVSVDRAIDGLTWLVLVHSPRKRVVNIVKSQWGNLRRNGWRWIPFQCSDMWHRVFDADRTPTPVSLPGREFSSAALRALPNVKIADVDDVHSQPSIQLVQAFAPWLGISLGAPILRRSVFALPEVGTINLHKGRVPDYRGMPPAFWELWNGEASVGCTVHWVDDKLDTGAVAARAVVQCEPFSTVKGLQLRLDEVGVDLVRSVVMDVLDGSAAAEPQGTGGRTRRKPTLKQVTALDRRLAGRSAPIEAKPKALLKAALGSGSHATWRSGLHHVLAPRITVLLYHRVTDSVRDNLSVGIEQFHRHMALLRKHCRVLSLPEVLDAQVIPRSRQPLVCVTFDDGYLDNWDNAVPILLSQQIPAAFFVTTGIVGTERAFPHDVMRGNPPIPVMDWNQLRSMKERGFAIGSHTVNHIDCAGESEAIVREELIRSRDTLRRELQVQDVVLAYPYGGRQHMTPQRLDLVKQAGYAGCLSAYGGSNLDRVDRYNVLRRPIHWEFSDRAFMSECVGIR